jgi:hypothetical protein
LGQIFLIAHKQFCQTKKYAMTSHTYIGYREGDHKTPYAHFFDENMKSIPLYAVEALKNSPFQKGSIPPLSNILTLEKEGYCDIENGYTLEADASLRIAILTEMPNVSPKMWDWWFGWHGCMANRYKLWHPKAHQDAVWKDGQSHEGYIGRTSMIEEYIGKKLEKANIRFIDPTELGFDPQMINDKNKVVFICARLGYTQFPLDFGWLVHQIRAVEGGSEMRSRFWVGGEHIRIRANGFLPKILSKFLQKINRLPQQQAIDLLTHCAEEMNHLALFLPKIYDEFGKK